MADISSINLNGNSYNIKDNNAVSKSGDTISGTVTFFQPGNSYTDSILCVGRGTKTYIGNLGNNKGYTRTGITQENVNGNKEYFRFPVSYSTENDNTHEILTSKNAVTVSQGGTNATTAADARTNLGAVSKTGDSVTGNYYVAGSIFLENDNDDITTTTGITTAVDSIYSIRDKGNHNLGYFRGRQETNGDVSVDIRARRRNDGTNVDNYLQLSVSTNGTRYVHIPESKQWRNALGGDDGIWPISLGGTGDTKPIVKTINVASQGTGTFSLPHNSSGSNYPALILTAFSDSSKGIWATSYSKNGVYALSSVTDSRITFSKTSNTTAVTINNGTGGTQRFIIIDFG